MNLLSVLPVNPILPINLLLGYAIFLTALRIYVWPRLATLSPATLLTPILLLHAGRELGLMFLFDGATKTGMPPGFAVPAAWGDLSAAVLAVIALRAVRTGAASARTWVWVFNLFGTADLLNAIAMAVIHQSGSYLGAAYWIPAFWVPMLLATHTLIFVYLLRHWRQPAEAVGRSDAYS
jgi:hypothetical protein